MVFTFDRMRCYMKSMQILSIGWLLGGKGGMFLSPLSKVYKLLPCSPSNDNSHSCSWAESISISVACNCHFFFSDTGSRIVISILCVPLVAGYVHPPKLGLPDIDEKNISCSPAGPHLVCVLPPALSSSFCIPAWLSWLLLNPVISSHNFPRLITKFRLMKY